MVAQIVSGSLNFVSNITSGILGFFNKKKELELQEKALDYQHKENITGADNDANILLYGQSKAKSNAVKNGMLGLCALIIGTIVLVRKK